MKDQIQIRYTKESSAGSNLSCGGNLSYLDLVPGQTILDLGCGRGRETIEAALALGPDGLAVGLDLTTAMVEKARQNAAGTPEIQTGQARVSFVQGDIESLPFADETFDAVISNCVINHARDKKQVYREIHRILKCGGYFIVSDACTREPLPESVTSDPQAWADCFGGAITREAYLASIETAGFPELEILKSREYVKTAMTSSASRSAAPSRRSFDMHIYRFMYIEDLRTGGV